MSSVQLRVMYDSHMSSQPQKFVPSKRVYFATNHKYFGDWASSVPPRLGASCYTVDIPISNQSFENCLKFALQQAGILEEISDSLVLKIKKAASQALQGEQVISPDWFLWSQGTEVWENLQMWCAN